MARYRKTVDLDYLVKEYLAGKSCNELSKELGVCRRGVEIRLRDAGVSVRGRSEAEVVKWSFMGEDARTRQTAAAHEAVRGTHLSFEAKCSHAMTVQAIPSNVSPIEMRVLRSMNLRGISMQQQTAVGPYNCDLTIHPIAVEVYGGKWHWSGHHLARVEERFRYIMNAGWNILVLAVYDPFPFTSAVANYLAREINRLRRHPPSVCQYRVIWGAGKFTAGGCLNDNEISIKPPFTHRRNPTNGRYETVPR